MVCGMANLLIRCIPDGLHPEREPVFVHLQQIGLLT
jgi:hypothetical protein